MAALLDRSGHGVLHLLHHAGVLLHANLSGLGVAAGIGTGIRHNRLRVGTWILQGVSFLIFMALVMRPRFWSGDFPRKAISPRRSPSILRFTRFPWDTWET